MSPDTLRSLWAGILGSVPGVLRELVRGRWADFRTRGGARGGRRDRAEGNLLSNAPRPLSAPAKPASAITSATARTHHRVPGRFR